MPARAKPLLKAAQRHALVCMYVEGARIVHREYMPEERFSGAMGAFYVGLCVALGHMDGKPFTVAKLALYLEAPRTSVIRWLDYLIKHDLVVRRGRHYFLKEERANAASAMKAHDVLVRLVKATAVQLSKMDT